MLPGNFSSAARCPGTRRLTAFHYREMSPTPLQKGMVLYSGNMTLTHDPKIPWIPGTSRYGRVVVASASFSHQAPFHTRRRGITPLHLLWRDFISLWEPPNERNFFSRGECLDHKAEDVSRILARTRQASQDRPWTQAHATMAGLDK